MPGGRGPGTPSSVNVPAASTLLDHPAHRLPAHPGQPQRRLEPEPWVDGDVARNGPFLAVAKSCRPVSRWTSRRKRMLPACLGWPVLILLIMHARK